MKKRHERVYWPSISDPTTFDPATPITCLPDAKFVAAFASAEGAAAALKLLAMPIRDAPEKGPPMAKMVSLRLSRKEAEKDYGIGPAAEPELPEYPYGTRIELDGEQVDALGLEDCEAEDEVEIEARGYIKSVEVTDREGEEPRRRLTIQITEISAEPDASAEKAKKESERLGRLAEPTK